MLRLLTTATLSVLLVSTAVPANEGFAEQIDAVAPIVNAGNLDSLGGPSTSAELLDDIDGRWFTLDNTVRNWGKDGDDTRATLARAIERLCGDDWENLVTHTALGPASFRVEQVSPEGEDQGTFDLVATDPQGRVFTPQMEEAYLLSVYGLEHAEPARQQEALDQFKAMAEQGVAIWRPTPDLWVNSGPDEAEIWGRCPR